MWQSLASVFNFLACCTREKVHRFVAVPFSKAARLNITHCSTEGALVLAFASWRAGVISVQTPRACLSPSKGSAAAFARCRCTTWPRPSSHSLFHGLEMLVTCSWTASVSSTWLFLFPISTFATTVTDGLIT